MRLRRFERTSDWPSAFRFLLYSSIFVCVLDISSLSAVVKVDMLIFSNQTGLEKVLKVTCPHFILLIHVSCKDLLRSSHFKTIPTQQQNLSPMIVRSPPIVSKEQSREKDATVKVVEKNQKKNNPYISVRHLVCKDFQKQIEVDLDKILQCKTSIQFNTNFSHYEISFVFWIGNSNGCTKTDNTWCS